jgi:hypothetical protein
MVRLNRTRIDFLQEWIMFWLRAAKKLFRADPDKMITVSPEEGRLLKMQARLVC